MTSNVGDKISETRLYKYNTTGYYRVSKLKHDNCKNGILYQYRYREDGGRRCISCTNIEGLKKKVEDKGLKWEKIK